MRDSLNRCCFYPPALPESAEWSYELKLDGYRAIAFKAGGKVHLRSRTAVLKLGRHAMVYCLGVDSAAARRTGMQVLPCRWLLDRPDALRAMHTAAVEVTILAGKRQASTRRDFRDGPE